MPSLEFCVCEKRHSRKRSVSTGANLPSFYVFFSLSPLYSISLGDKGEGCLTVTYQSYVCVRLRVWARRLSGATVNLCAPVDFPGLFPRFKQPHPSSTLHHSQPPPPQQYYYGPMWTLALNPVSLFLSLLLWFSHCLLDLVWICSPLRAPVLVALALIETGMKYEDAVQFIRQ